MITMLIVLNVALALALTGLAIHLRYGWDGCQPAQPIPVPGLARDRRPPTGELIALYQAEPPTTRIKETANAHHV